MVMERQKPTIEHLVDGGVKVGYENKEGIVKIWQDIEKDKTQRFLAECRKHKIKEGEQENPRFLIFLQGSVV